MTGLAEFLTARYDEDEAAAEAILDDPDYEAKWHEQSSGVLYVGPGSERYPLDGLCPLGDSRLTRFIARHDPARVLREVEAKRRILADYEMWRAHADSDPAGVTTMSKAAAGALLPSIRGLAHVYNDHPDYDPAWAITAPASP